MDTEAGRITKDAWFGPKKYVGWGWRIRNWKGAVTSVVFVALTIVTATFLGRSLAGILIVSGLFVAFLLVAWLTGTRPGGPSTERSSKLPPTRDR